MRTLTRETNDNDLLSIANFIGLGIGDSVFSILVSNHLDRMAWDFLSHHNEPLAHGEKLLVKESAGFLKHLHWGLDCLGLDKRILD